MLSPSSEAFTSVESQKEHKECAAKKKRLADDPIECKC